ETAQEKPQEGEIIAVGPGALDDSGKRVPPEVKAGDFVLFGKWSGTEVKIDGEELLIMKESDILGVLEGKPSSERAAACLGVRDLSQEQSGKAPRSILPWLPRTSDFHRTRARRCCVASTCSPTLSK